MRKYLMLTLFLLWAATAYASVDALIESVKKGDTAAVKSMLQKGESVNNANSQGNTALHYAVATDNSEMVQLLMRNGADMDIKNTKGWSPLMIAEKKNVPNVYGIMQKVKTAKTAAEQKNTIVIDKKASSKPIQIPAKEAALSAPIMSDFSDEVNIGDEEIIYCLNFLGLQGEHKNMSSAAAYFAVEAGINKTRHDEVVRISKEYYENASAEQIKNRADECAPYITPHNVSKQNQIIRSLNKSMGY